MKTSSNGCGVSINPYSNSAIHYMWYACQNQSNVPKLAVYIGKETSGETGSYHNQFNNNTYQSFKMEFNNGVLKVYQEGTLVTTINNLGYLNGETRSIYFGEWISRRTIYVKNIKIKPL